MVAKINNGASIYGAVSYNQEKVDEKQARIISSNKMIENTTGRDDLVFSQTLRSFEPYLLANKRTQKPVVHISLNPSPEDKLSDEQFAKLGHDYMEQMGFKDQPYIIYIHEDIDRKHIHIVSVRVDENGKKIKDSFENLRSMAVCRDLEVKYGLKQITNEEHLDSGYKLKKVDYNAGDIKRQIANTVRTLSKDYRFQTIGEYNALLSCFNIQCKHIKGEDQGNLFNGIVYSAMNDNGDVVGNPIKSSRIGKSVGFDNLNKLMAKSSELLKKETDPYKSKAIISKAMQTAANKDDFIQKLKADKIDVVFRENESGRIYGVTFINHKNKLVFNGSRLGKEFSANVFNNLFNENSGSLSTKKQNADKQSSNFEMSSFEDLEKSLNNTGSASVDEMFGTFGSSGLGYNPEEEDFRRRMQRKKRKGRKKGNS